MVANALFSDGAAAVIVSAGKAQVGQWQLVDQRSHVLPDSAEVMTWRIGDHGFEMTLSADVPTMIRESLREWLEDWLFERGLAIDDVRGWIVHPGGPHILSACSDALELAHGCARRVVRRARGIRQHVVAHGAVHSRSDAARRGQAALRDARLRPGAVDRRGSVLLGKAQWIAPSEA